METMDVEAYAASIERLLGEMWGTAAAKSTIESLKETVARLRAHFVQALKQSMKPHAKKVQGVLRPLACQIDSLLGMTKVTVPRSWHDYRFVAMFDSVCWLNLLAQSFDPVC